MEQLKMMKERLVECVEKQINSNLEYANAQELGEAVDMIKDLSEAIYYCTITEAMDEKDQMERGNHYPVSHYYGDRYLPEYPMYMDRSTMYAEGGQGGGGGGGSRNYTPMLYASGGGGSGGGGQGGGGGGQGGGRNYTPMMFASDGNQQSRGESRNYTPMMYAGGGQSMYHSPEYGYPPMPMPAPAMSPEYEGRSPMVRRRYMDGKKQNDKHSQMQELEQYTQELASDLTDMVKDASPEEKQLLQQKISLLASKIK